MENCEYWFFIIKVSGLVNVLLVHYICALVLGNISHQKLSEGFIASYWEKNVGATRSFI